ncbi:MAG TPA: hypothetical protein VMU36_13400 [Spirochaetia bacterium]|nr:hypothetical protein [Spirochaetia bacterium]
MLPAALSLAPMALAWAPAALAWTLPPLGGALIGLAVGRAASGFVMRRAASGPGAGRAAARLVPGLTASLLERPLAEIAGEPDALGAAVAKSVEAALRGLVTSSRFLHEVRQSIAALVSSICALPVADLLARTNAKRFFVDQLLPALSREESRRAIAEAAGAALGKGPGALISDNTLGAVSRAFDRLLPVVIERLIEWLESDDTRSTMAARGRELLPRILEKLNLMQRFLLSAGQFDRRIDEKMPEIVEETLNTLERVLREPAQQRSMRDAAVLALRNWRSSGQSNSDAAIVVTDIVDGILGRLTDPAAREAVFSTLEGLLGAGGQTLGSLLRKRAGVSESEIADSLANALLAWVSRPETAASVSAWAAEKTSEYLRENAGFSGARILSVDAVRKEKIDSFLTQTVARMASMPGFEISGGIRGSALRWAGAFSSLLGLLVGLFADLLRLLGIF